MAKEPLAHQMERRDQIDPAVAAHFQQFPPQLLFLSLLLFLFFLKITMKATTEVLVLVKHHTQSGGLGFVGMPDGRGGMKLLFGTFHKNWGMCEC